MVVGKLWRNREGTAMKWVTKFYWHPQCWIDQAIQKLERLPPVVETRGMRKPKVPDEMRGARVKIMARRAAIVQRIKIEMSKNDGTSVDKLIHLGEMLNRLKEEIELVGGAPESWR